MVGDADVTIAVFGRNPVSIPILLLIAILSVEAVDSEAATDGDIVSDVIELDADGEIVAELPAAVELTVFDKPAMRSAMHSDGLFGKADSREASQDDVAELAALAGKKAIANV